MFTPSSEDIINPERGFWKFSGDDFAQVKLSDLQAMRAEGISIAYGLVRLDEFREQKLPDQELANIENAFGLARQSGIKIILRFAYNYPQSSQDYENAKDASLSVVRNHILQLAPVINRNKDLIVVFQAGFIGAWGEQHTSSNGLETQVAKRALRDALLEALDPAISIQWRYPADIIPWLSTMAEQEQRRIAFHNDCFLSSSTDVGTYDEDPVKRKIQRAAMKKLTADHYFSGEVCDAQKDKLRNDCKSIMQEGAAYHLNSLNIDYYVGFHKKWKVQGCFDDVSKKMGYRFMLKSAEIVEGVLSVNIANVGWARHLKRRPIILTIDGKEKASSNSIDLSTIEPGQTAKMKFAISPVKSPVKLCLRSPDPEPRLRNDARYAIQFANTAIDGQVFDKQLMQFCFTAN